MLSFSLSLSFCLHPPLFVSSFEMKREKVAIRETSMRALLLAPSSRHFAFAVHDPETPIDPNPSLALLVERRACLASLATESTTTNHSKSTRRGEQESLGSRKHSLHLNFSLRSNSASHYHEVCGNKTANGTHIRRVIS